MEQVTTHSVFPIFAFLPILFYIVIIGFTIWFAITLIKTQKEKNRILKEISSNLKRMNGNRPD